ncbi:hypothetical protein [Candidatus Uabimicrobium amorphum]|uniref:Transglutaminase-like domain-containing protein n=1 Tax=Uabimicrobium amorphum TaxID=2596890 RepID=A0A5S9INT0_UABAM|nr:hypothetical protein [Candidatus Uabimicrobium amorphum]BBM85318.1 hypothetical protein UABAM_03684 [Candidatus Uabimicrobium amorphum]
MRIVIGFILVLLVGCSDSLEQKAKEAVKQKKYLKAHSLYKRAIANKPRKEKLYTGLQETIALVIHQGVKHIKENKFNEAINTLNPVALDKEYPSVDAKVGLGIAYLNSYKMNKENIFRGFLLFMSALKQSKMRIPMTGIHKDILAWLVEKGLSKEDILHYNFRKTYDVGTVYRQFLFYNIVQEIMKQKSAPRPEFLAQEQDEKILHLHNLLVWCVHNMKVVSPQNKYCAPVSSAWNILRGYGSKEQRDVCFAFLCQQLKLPCYFLQANGTIYPIVKVNDKWICIDFSSHSFLLHEKNYTFSLPQLLKTLKANETGKIWLVFPPRSIVPRMSILTRLHLFYKIESPEFYYDINQHATRVYKDLGTEFSVANVQNLITNSDKLNVQIYEKPIEIWSKYNHNKDEKFIKNWQDKAPIDGMTIQMILLSVTGQKFYTKNFIEEIKKPKNEEFFLYYNAWGLKNIGEIDAAQKKFLLYLEKYKGGFWEENVKMHLGQIDFWQEKQESTYYKETFLKDSYFVK